MKLVSSSQVGFDSKIYSESGPSNIDLDAGFNCKISWNQYYAIALH